MSKYDFNEMATKMAPFITHQDSFCAAVKSADDSVDDNVQTSSGAIRGVLGNKLKKEWEDNCSVLLNFDAYFNDLTRRAVEVYNSKSTTTDEVVGELTQTTADENPSTSPIASTENTEQGGE